MATLEPGSAGITAGSLVIDIGLGVTGGSFFRPKIGRASYNSTPLRDVFRSRNRLLNEHATDSWDERRGKKHVFLHLFRSRDPLLNEHATDSWDEPRAQKLLLFVPFRPRKPPHERKSSEKDSDGRV